MRHFPLAFRGYDRSAVDRHLQLIVGWLSLSGLDDLIRERFDEQDPLGHQLRARAEGEAEQIREEARQVLEAAHHDAEGIKAKARQEADKLLAAARADAAAAQRGPLARFLSRGPQDR